MPRRLRAGLPGPRRTTPCQTRLAIAVDTARRLGQLAVQGDDLLNVAEGGGTTRGESFGRHQTAMQIHDALTAGTSCSSSAL